MDNGYLRPRYNGYLHFQDHAGLPLQQCILEQVEPEVALAEMNKIYHQSLIPKNTIVNS
jgi:multiple sugar transport system substrate-binding protein